jgi:hypothetical protein
LSVKKTLKRLRFIPYRKHDVVEMCLRDQPSDINPQQFKKLCQMLSSIFHFEFYQVTESMKNTYASVNPDSDTRDIGLTDKSDNIDFVNLLGGLLEKANYERISEAELNRAMSEESLFKIRLHVDFNDFSEVLLFCRGETLRKETISSLFGLFSKEITFINYERVVVYLRFNDDFVPDSGLEAYFQPGATVLKLFQNVPKADLEMLFPNTRVRMRTLDKLLIGIPAAISGGIVITTKLGATIVLIGSLLGFWLGFSSQPVEINTTVIVALFAGLAAFGGYLWKQFSNFKNRKLKFMQTLTQNLYFKNLDNNAGVFHRLADDAEEEECKEAILAYYFLLSNPDGLTQEGLDNQIESWFHEQWQCTVDFEIDDALNKLLSLGLIEKTEYQYKALVLEGAIKALDKRWDNYFQG